MNEHAEDRGYVRLRCSKCGWSDNGSTIYRKNASAYTGGPCAMCKTNTMEAVEFLVTDPFKDLSKTRDIIASMRGRAHTAEQAHHLLVGATTEEFNTVCDAFDLVLDALQDMVNQHAGGLSEGQQVHGHGLSSNAYALQTLEKLGVVKLTGGVGRCIYGVWNAKT